MENPTISDGFSSREVKLEKLPTGLLRPASKELEGVGADASLTVLQRDQTGVDWYSKPDNTPLFDSGKVIPVAPGEDALFNAVA